MKVEMRVGSWYKTRSGKVAHIEGKNNKIFYGNVRGNPSIVEWTSEGRQLYSKFVGLDDTRDIVKEIGNPEVFESE